MLAQQQPRDQIPRDHEEQVDTEKAAAHPAHVEVVAEHGQHGDRAESVEPSGVRKSKGGLG